ncbi:uncharacterized protein LOC143240869 isoform X2 [Tachypleus tridentatus]|uniref:uncharacterized protein LOC143240869 isoform X2 n=1 Tax=Tachypleus tridentatus TaxID=6853 RepID=UPI003FD637ED
MKLIKPKEELNEVASSCLSMSSSSAEELKRELKELQQCLKKEEAARKATESQLLDALLENKKLRSQLEQKQQQPKGQTLVDDLTLDAITETFDKFHRFLDLLRQFGLEDLVKLSGIDTKSKHIKLECRKKTHSPDRKQKVKPGLQVQQEPNNTSNFITTPTENGTLGSQHTAMIPKIRTSVNSTNTHQLQEDTDHKNCDLSFKPVVLNSVNSMIRTLQNTTSSQQNNTRRTVQLLPEDVEQRNSNLDFKPDVLNKVHNPSLSVEKASFYKAGDDLFQYVMNKVSDALISLNHASNKEAVDISTYLVNPSVARDSQTSLTQTTNSQPNLSDGEGFSHLKNVENKVKKSMVDQRKSSYPQLQMGFRDSYGTLQDKVDNCKNELQQGSKSKENSVCHHQLESNSGFVMQPLDHRDSSHRVVTQPLDHRDSSNRVVTQPLDHRDSSHGVVTQPLDHRDSSHGVVTQPLDHRDSSHGIVTQPLDHRDSSPSVVTQPLDHKYSSHGVVTHPLDHRDSSHGVVTHPLDHRDSSHGVVTQPLDHRDSSHGVVTQPLDHRDSSHGVVTQPLDHKYSSYGVVTHPLDHRDSSSCSRTTQDLRSKSEKTAVMFASDLLAMSTGLEAHVAEKEMESDSYLVPEVALLAEEQHSTSVESRYEKEKSHSLSSKQGKATSVYSDTFETSNDEEICENLHKGVDSSGNTNSSVKEELEVTLKSVSESLETESMDTGGTLKKDVTSNGKIEEKEVQHKLSLNASLEVPELNENNKPLFKSLDKHVDDLPSFSSLNSLTGLTDMETPSISLSSSVSNKLTGSDIEDF